jgi:hypothetical protein
MLEIQRSERTSGGSRGRSARTINALVHESAGEGTGQSREAERTRSVSPYGGSQGSGGSGSAMNFCTGCRCKHLESGGPGVCPWRKTDTAGKPIKYPQFNGWDPVYFATKGQHIRDIMANRASRVKDPKAKMDLPKWNLFIAEVDKELLKRESRR